MAPEELIALAESTKNEIASLKASLRKKYPQSSQQVTNKEIRQKAKSIAEQWFTQLMHSHLISGALNDQVYADLSVEFQRLYSTSDKSAKRSTYDQILQTLNKLFSAEAILAVKTSAAKRPTSTPLLTKSPAPLVVADKLLTAFIGHSFDSKDKSIADAVIGILNAIGVITVTGEKPKADKISDKVKDLIESQEIFVGIFTRRDKLQGRNEWTTTSWVLEEKAYAVAKKKRLVMIREDDIGSIGGMHGDHEYIPFSRNDPSPMLIKVIQMFDVRTSGLR